MQVTFQYIYLLGVAILLPIILILFFIAKNKRKQTIKKLGDPHLVKLLIGNYRAASFLQKFICLFLATALLIVALANPRIPSGTKQVNRSGIEVMIVLDVSKSMLAQDVKPNRLERAKQMLSRLIDKLGNDNVGIIVFAGRAYLQMPLSNDLAAAKMYLGAATPASIPTQGTVINDALKMSYASFTAKDQKYKAVVLVSDGEDHDEGAVQTAKEMAAEGVVIYTVGVGSKEGAPIMDDVTQQIKVDENGNTVITKLNEAALQEIALNGQGDYQFFSSAEVNASNIVAKINTMDQRQLTSDSFMNYETLFQIFAGHALMLLLLELLVAETFTINSRKIKPVLTALCAMVTVCAAAQTDKGMVKEGNTFYNSKDYGAAAERYSNALIINPANVPARFNLGNALYKADKKEAAILAYDSTITVSKIPADQSKAYYNRGVVLQNSNQIPACIEAYKAALRISPDDDDARQNLQKALQKQKEDKKNDKKEDDKKDKDKKEDQKPKPQPSKLTPKEAEERLKALMQQEKNLQDKLRKNNAQSANQPQKDW